MIALTNTGSSGGVYEAGTEEAPARNCFAVLVNNEPGVLARVVGLFSGRGYNIESLTVDEGEHLAQRARSTIVTNGPPMIINQIKAQLGRLRLQLLGARGPFPLVRQLWRLRQPWRLCRPRLHRLRAVRVDVHVG